MKKYLIIFAVLAAAAVAGFIYFTKDDITFSKETSLYKAIPITSPFFVEFNSLKSIPVDNQILNELANVNVAPSFFEWKTKIESVIRENSEVTSSLKNENFILSFSFAGKDVLFPLLIKKVDNNNKRKNIENLLKTLFVETEYKYENSNYNGFKNGLISDKKGELVFHYCFTGGLFIGSNKTVVVEESLRQLNNQSIAVNPYFSMVNKTATSQADVSVYINHKQFPEMFAHLLSNKTTKKTNEFEKTVSVNYQNKMEDFIDFAAWTELDLTIDNHEILVNGISAADDSLNHFISVFNGQTALRFSGDDVLPKNTSFFCNYTFSNKENFFNRLETHFSHSQNYYSREQQIKKLEAALRISFKETLISWVKNEVIVATSVIPVEPENKVSYFILETEGKTSVEKSLSDILLNYAKNNEINFSDLQSTYSVDKETQFTIYQFPFPSLPGIWLGNPFELAEANFVTFHGNYMVFSNKKSGLEDYLHSMVLDATLSKDLDYLKFKQKIDNRANINTYLNINRAFSWKDEILNSGFTDEINKREEFIRKFGMINWQVLNNKDIYFNSILMGFNENAKEEAQTTWQSNIGNQIIGKPQIVDNHESNSEREVILQDNKNTVHLLTNDGRIRWSVPLEEPVLSDFFQIDVYRNGKLQYLFNTKSKLYLLDRNGNNVAQFPIAFRSPASNGVNVFDYDNNRKYRFFVACENKKVYAYDSEGKIITGWNFNQTDFEVNTPVQHFRVANKDYIVFKDKSRVYIQDRRGETRVKLETQFEHSKNPLVLNETNSAKIVDTDVNGKVYYIGFDGKVTEKSSAKFSQNHFFTVDDLDGNNIPDFVFVDGKELTIIDENGKKIYTEKFRNEIQNKPNIYSFSSKLKKVGVVDSRANKIYLFNPDGELHNDFPLQGNSEFSIGQMEQNSGRLNLIVGSEGGDLYNYTLN